MPQSNNQTQAIRNLQTYLRQLSYHNPAIVDPPIDGVFDSRTRQSLKDFQTSQGIPDTGIANQAVWELLYAAYRASVAANSAPYRMAVFPGYPQNVEYQPGSAGFPVSAIQFMLGELTKQYSSITAPAVDGIYGDATAGSVMEFQRLNRLPETGRVDKVTWNEMTDQYNVLFIRFPVE